MMRRWFVFVVVLALVSGACAGDSGAPPSTEAPTVIEMTVTTAEAIEPTTRDPADTSTTVVVPGWPAVEVLVTNDAGVFLIDTEGEITQLVKGRVAYAVDDTRGGLLFQGERNRSPAWVGDVTPVKDTRVWWVQAGSAAPQELLVPTPGRPHDLSLHDAFESGDGNIAVLYVRHGSRWDSEAGPFTFRDELRTFTLGSGTVRDLTSLRGYEAGLGLASGSGSVVAVTVFAHEPVSECVFLDPNSGDRLSIPAAPVIDPNRDEGYPSGCVLSDEWLAYMQLEYLEWRVVAVELAGAGQERTFEFDRLTSSLDLVGSYLLVNHRSEWRDDGPATLIDLPSGDSWSVPLDGVARLAASSIHIAAPVVAPEPGVIGLRSAGTWQRVDLPGVQSVADVVPVGAGFFAIGTDADGLAGWVSQAGLEWARVDVVEQEAAGRCHAWRVHATGSRLVADVHCRPSEGSTNTIPRPMVSWNGWHWNEARAPLRTVEIEPGAWQVIWDWQLAAGDQDVLLHGSPGVAFDWAVFLPRHVAPSVLDRLADGEGWASLEHDDDGTGMVVIRSGGRVIYEARFDDDLGVSDALKEASRRTEPHLWRSGPNLTFEDLGAIEDLGPGELDELVGTPSGFYALDNWWSAETGLVLDIWRSRDGLRWRRAAEPDIDFAGDLAGLERFEDGILIEGHIANAPAIEMPAFFPSTGWTSIPIPAREDLCHGANATAVGSSGLIAGWSDMCVPGPHGTQSPAYIRQGDVTLRVDRPAGIGGPAFQIRSNATDQVLMDVFDPDDGSIVTDDDTVTFRSLDTGETVLTMAVDDLLDGVCFEAPKTLWWSLSDLTGRWEPHPAITGSKLVAANQHLVVAVDQEPERDRSLCQPLTEMFPERFVDPEPEVWIGWVG